MAKPLPKEVPAENGGLYMPNWSARPFFSTGSYLVDLQMGGGYAERQIVKIRGDSQTGKSLFAIEAAANFLQKNPDGRVRYVDRENAFDDNYVTHTLGIDMARFTKPAGLKTVEDVAQDILAHLDAFSVNRTESERKAALAAAKKTSKKKAAKKKASKKKAAKKKAEKLPIDDRPMIYVVDSWDGLSDDGELNREISDPKTYGMAKAKKGHEIGRRVQTLCEGVPFTLVVVTQNKYKMSAMPGLPPTRSNSGGSWLDYFPTQTIELATEKWLENTRKGHTRKYGRWIKVWPDKNRRSGPQHPIFVPIVLRYGLCDLSACVRYLIDEDAWSLMFESAEDAKKYLGAIWSLDDERYDADLAKARGHAGDVFADIEQLFQPKRKKYGNKLKAKG